jgi:hypothetical protein
VRSKILTAIGLSLGLLISSLASGCAGMRQEGEGDPAIAHLKRIGLAPVVDMARVYGPERSARAPLTGKVFVTGSAAPELAAMMTARIEEHLAAQGFEVVGPATVQAAMDQVDASAAGPLAQHGLVLTAGRNLEVDAVLVGYLYRVREREGGRFAAAAPASVAYGLYLMETGQGRLIWFDEFDETQKSLDENLLAFGTFLKRRGEWISADQMVAQSLKEMLSGFGAQR